MLLGIRQAEVRDDVAAPLFAFVFPAIADRSAGLMAWSYNFYNNFRVFLRLRQ